VSVNVLYVATATTIRTINLNTLAVATLAGSPTGASGADPSTVGSTALGTNALFARISSIAVDYAGANIYLAAKTNNMINKVALSVATVAAGTVPVTRITAASIVADTTLPSAIVAGQKWETLVSAPNPFVYFTVQSPGAQIRNSSSSAWFAGSTTTTGYVDGAVASAQFRLLTGIAGTASYLVVADTQTPGSVLRVVQEGVVFTLAGQATVSGFTDGIGTRASFGTLVQNIVTDTPITQVFATDVNNNAIRRIGVEDKGVTTIAGGNRNTGSSGFVDGVATNSLFNGPRGIAVSTGGYVYVADTGNNVIRILRPY